MLGFITNKRTRTNELKISIPDELKGMELQIIVLPANKTNAEIEFFTKAELKKLSKSNLGTSLIDNEDYTKW